MGGGRLSTTSRTVAIIQARMGSSRLPGKMMKDLGGYPLLHWVLQRVKNSKRLDDVVLATTDLSQDDSLEDLARQLEVQVYRGSEKDLIQRFLGAAEMTDARTIVRVCADNPLVAPEEIDRLIDSYFAELSKEVNPDHLYLFNFGPKKKNNYPDGLGAEIFSCGLLKVIAEKTQNDSHLEHVTSYIWENPEDYLIQTIPAPPEIAFPGLKLDVDTQEDLEKLNLLCGHLDLGSTAQEIVETHIKFLDNGVSD